MEKRLRLETLYPGFGVVKIKISCGLLYHLHTLVLHPCCWTTSSNSWLCILAMGIYTYNRYQTTGRRNSLWSRLQGSRDILQVRCLWLYTVAQNLTRNT